MRRLRFMASQCLSHQRNDRPAETLDRLGVVEAVHDEVADAKLGKASQRRNGMIGRSAKLPSPGIGSSRA